MSETNTSVGENSPEVTNELIKEGLLGLSNEKGEPVPLKSIDVEISIRGTIAVVKSCLSYHNEEDDAVEAVFTFPVDDGSAVFGFAADIGDRHIEAEVQEKEQAELTYDDAVKSGLTAMLLKETDSCSDVFKCSLGNLPSHTHAKLSLSYVLDLKPEPDGCIRFTLPTVLNPRYSPDAGGTMAAEGATYVPPCQVPYSFSMAATVMGYNAVSTVKSDTLELDVKLEDNNKLAKISLKEEFKFDHDLSFYVEYEKLFEPRVVFEKGNLSSESEFLKQDMLMMSFYPDLKEVSMATSGEYIFIIDRSRSMEGRQMKMAKEALLLFLKSLPPDCLFNVVSFGSSFKTLFSGGSKSYKESNLEKAIQLQQSMDANMGGTEILQPLKHIFKNSPVHGHDKNVFVLTDGEVYNTKDIISLVQKNRDNTRVFAVGIGDGVSTSLVKGIARAGNGTAEFITGQDRIQPKVIALLKLAMQPCVSDVQVTWDLPPEITAITIPDEVPTLLTPGQCLTLFALIQGVDEHTIYSPSTVTLTGKLQKQPVTFSMTFDLSPDDETDEHEAVTQAPVHLLASKTQIKLLEDKYSAIKPDLYGTNISEKKTEMDQLRQQIISLSRHANIVSQQTAFVAIDKDGQTVESTMVQRPCPVPSVSEQYFKGYVDTEGSFSFKSCGFLDDPATLASRGSSGNVMVYFNSCSMPDSRKRKKKSSGLLCGLQSVFRKSSKKKKVGKNSMMESMGADQAGTVDSSDVIDLTKICPEPNLQEHSVGKNSMMESMEADQAGTVDASDIIDLTEICPEPNLQEHSVVKNSMMESMEADQAGTVDTSDVIDLTEICPEPNLQEHSGDKMLAVISLQKLQGNWEVSEKLCQLLDVKADDVKDQNVVKDDTTAITLGVVFWLRTHFSQLHAEWQMIETKALKWLTTQGQLMDTPAEELMALIGKKLWPDTSGMETAD